MLSLFRRFAKSKSLHIVNFVGLSIVLACLLLSAGYIKRELSYDRHHTHADRIVRLSLQFDDEPVDGRISGNNMDDVLQQIPEIDRVVKMSKIYTVVLTYQGNHHVINGSYAASRELLHVFDIPLLQGDKEEELQQRERMLVSESFARQLTGESGFDELLGAEVLFEERSFFISGIFSDIPETSHFHTDILIHRRDDSEMFAYTYLLLKNQTSIHTLEQKITELAGEKKWRQSKPRALLMPLTDIHLHSRNLREMGVNGNILYIYLIVGANLLLLIVVLSNLWLNASLIFAFNRRYYQLLRLNGASPSTVLKDETISALALGILACCTGFLIAYFIPGNFRISLSVWETGILILLFLTLIIFVSLLPVLAGLSSTLFSGTAENLKPSRFSYANVKYMLTAQYVIVMLAAILGFGINRQMATVRNTQVGGDAKNILVLPEQPEQVQEQYGHLRAELLKHPAIEDVTACFQLPGDAIRDAIQVRFEDSEEFKMLPLMVAGEGFIPFFNIELIAGENFMPPRTDYSRENQLLMDKFKGKISTDGTEEYMINRKALQVLGLRSPEEAIGRILYLQHGTLDYVPKGRICGVTDNFYYTSQHEDSIPLLILQRSLFLHCVMVRFDYGQYDKAMEIFNTVWNEVNPDFPANYLFMKDVFGRIYYNELNAEKLTLAFSLLCLVIANLGLIIFMASMIKRRTREIGIRKINGASVGEIIRMLNMNFVQWILLAFVIAVPLAYFIMRRWLENFASKTILGWWVFLFAGLFVLVLSVIAVSLQTFRAATANPAEVMKNEWK